MRPLPPDLPLGAHAEAGICQLQEDVLLYGFFAMFVSRREGFCHLQAFVMLQGLLWCL